jgi:hypothetical protein
LIETGAASCRPSEPRTAPSPVGTVITSVVDGMKGAVGSNTNVVRFGCLHDPVAGGTNDGSSEPRETGMENFTVIGEFEAIPMAPSAGVLETTDRGGSVVVVVGATCPVAFFGDPPPCPTRYPIPAATMTTARSPMSRAHTNRGRGFVP